MKKNIDNNAKKKSMISKLILKLIIFLAFG